jgi:hypothetical protein
LPQQLPPPAQQPWPVTRPDVRASLATEPQQSFARAQQSAPAWQQGWAPAQHDFAWAQQSLPRAQQASLAGAAQHAWPLPQQASFKAQQSAGADFAPAPPPPRVRPTDRAMTPNRFANMSFSTNQDV